MNIFKYLKISNLMKNGSVYFAENSIDSLILVTKPKKNEYFSILKIFDILLKKT